MYHHEFQSFQSYIIGEEWKWKYITTVAWLYVDDGYDTYASMLLKFEKIYFKLILYIRRKPLQEYTYFEVAQSINWNWLKTRTLKWERIIFRFFFVLKNINKTFNVSIEFVLICTWWFLKPCLHRFILCNCWCCL